MIISPRLAVPTRKSIPDDLSIRVFRAANVNVRSVSNAAVPSSQQVVSPRYEITVFDCTHGPKTTWSTRFTAARGLVGRFKKITAGHCGGHLSGRPSPPRTGSDRVRMFNARNALFV